MPRRLGRFRPIPASPKAASRRRASRRSPDPPPVPPARLTLRPLVYQVEELTKQNEQLILALDAANRQVAELGASLETGGDRLAAGVRESKIVDVSKKNRVLRLELEREKAEKARLGAQLKALKARLGEPNEKRTESQVEAACREVVEEASKNAESATKECAEWREKWKQASARAERFSGQKAYIKTENDRLKTIIKREIGDDVDFGKLDDEIAATGGWRGRARRIRDLAAERDFLKTQLADANDALAAIAEEPEADGAGDKPRRETPLEATRRELEETRLRLAKARDDAERQRERRRAAGADLAAAEASLQQRMRREAMAEGVTFLDPDTVYLSFDTKFGRDVTVGQNVVFGPGCDIEDAVTIKAFSHLEGAKIAEGAEIGPFARIRPGSEIGRKARIGNFVETKKAKVEEGAKINHLSSTKRR